MWLYRLVQHWHQQPKNDADDAQLERAKKVVQSATIQNVLGLEPNAPLSGIRCSASIQLLNSENVTVRLEWITISKVKGISFETNLLDGVIWLFIAEANAVRDRDPESHAERAFREKLYSSVLKFAYRKGAEFVFCSPSSARARCDSMKKAVEIIFEFLGQFNFFIPTFFLYHHISKEVIDVVSSRIRKWKVRIDRLYIFAYNDPSHVPLIDAAYKNGCNYFFIRHVRQVDEDGQTELSFTWILKSALFKAIFGEDEDAYYRYCKVVEIIHNNSMEYNDILSRYVKDKSATPLIILALRIEDLRDFGEEHRSYCLTPYCGETSN